MGDGTTGGSSTPPGWYPDPQVAGQQRWWDGNAWTDHAAPMGGAVGGPSAPQQQWPAAGVPASGSTGAAGGPIDTWLWQSIVATVLCCMPLGIPAIVFSSQAQSAITMGNLVEAQAKADQAKTFTLISAGLGLLPWAFGLLWIFGMGTLLWSV